MGTLEYKVIDNFLEKELFYKFKDNVFNVLIPWYFIQNQVKNTNDNFYFFHMLYEENKVKSPFLYEDFICPLLSKLECKALICARLNLLIDKGKPIQSSWHIDRTYTCNTAIFYMNNNDGYTLLDKNNNIKIESIENRILIFNSQIEHCAISQTNTDRRIVVNFNYF